MAKKENKKKASKKIKKRKMIMVQSPLRFLRV